MGKITKILYVAWGENIAQYAIEGFVQAGYDVRKCLIVDMFAYEKRREIEEYLEKELEGRDAAFSFDYVPMISVACMAKHVPYVSWLYDAGLLTAQSLTVTNPCNYIFSFDELRAEDMIRRGAKHVYTYPLATKVFEEFVPQSDTPEMRDVSFLGNFYDDENFSFKQIRYMPSHLRGYIDALIAAQTGRYGMPLVRECFGEKEAAVLGQFAKVHLGGEYRQDGVEIFRDWIYQAVTVRERYDLIKSIGEQFELFVASAKTPEDIRCEAVGYLDYKSRMPAFFNGSRININITLRSIECGIPLRCLDVMGCGGFLLTNYQSDLEKYFKNGQELVWFYDKQDMLDKIAYYLSHEEERREIAMRGYEAMQAFSYEKQLSVIMDTVEQVTGLP